MVMNPNEAFRLAQTASELAKNNRNTPEAFLLSYVAWEILRARILIVGLFVHGESVSTASKILISARIWRQSKYDEIFEELFTHLPEQSPGMGKVFREVRRYKRMRDQYVHGSGRYSPETMRMAALRLTEIVKTDWDTDMKKLLKKTGEVAGRANPLTRLTVRRIGSVRDIKNRQFAQPQTSR